MLAVDAVQAAMQAALKEEHAQPPQGRRAVLRVIERARRGIQMILR
jgi:hypothetical protein